MATSKPLEEENEKDPLTCSLCSELYKSPKVLPCLHTFCEPCLENLITTLGTNKQEIISPFKCPECRTTVKPLNSHTDVGQWVKDLPSNTIISMMLIQKGENDIKCDMCKRADETSGAKFWCPSCIEALCEPCEKMHGRMKLSKDHKTVLLTEIGHQNKGIDLSAVSEKCLFHPDKELDLVCTDHKLLCCSFCISSSHQTCAVTPIDETKKTMKDFFVNLPDKLTTLQEETLKLLEKKKQQKSDLQSSVEVAKQDAESFVEDLKSNLDRLLEFHKKEIAILYEEENTKMNVTIRLIEQFMKAIAHWINVTSFMKANSIASSTKDIVLKETMKSQLNESLAEIYTTTQNQNVVNVSFKQDTNVKAYLEALESVGSMELDQLFPNEEIAIFSEKCKIGGFLTSFLPLFDDVRVTYKKSIRVPGKNILCGICISSDYSVVGHVDKNGYVYLLNTDSGVLLNDDCIKTTVRPKHLCYNTEKSQLYISCHSQEMFTVKVTENKLQTASSCKREQKLGGICCTHDQIYLVSEGAILSFKFTENLNNPSFEVKKCFDTNTGILSLGIVYYTNKLYYNTKDKEVKCSVVDGTDVFCFKSPTINEPRNLAVLSFGLVLVFDVGEEGKLHLLSADGSKSRVLLENFETVTEPAGFWMDPDEKTLYICGKDNIDVYGII